MYATKNKVENIVENRVENRVDKCDPNYRNNIKFLIDSSSSSRYNVVKSTNIEDAVNGITLSFSKLEDSPPDMLQKYVGEITEIIEKTHDIVLKYDIKTLKCLFDTNQMLLPIYNEIICSSYKTNLVLALQKMEKMLNNGPKISAIFYHLIKLVGEAELSCPSVNGYPLSKQLKQLYNKMINSENNLNENIQILPISKNDLDTNNKTASNVKTDLMSQFKDCDINFVNNKDFVIKYSTSGKESIFGILNEFNNLKKSPPDMLQKYISDVVEIIEKAHDIILKYDVKTLKCFINLNPNLKKKYDGILCHSSHKTNLVSALQKMEKLFDNGPKILAIIRHLIELVGEAELSCPNSDGGTLSKQLKKLYNLTNSKKPDIIANNGTTPNSETPNSETPNSETPNSETLHTMIPISEVGGDDSTTTFEIISAFLQKQWMIILIVVIVLIIIIAMRQFKQ